MKVQELFEGPYHIDDDYRPSIKMDNYPSTNSLNRECTFLGTLEKEDTIFNMWLSKEKHYAQVTTSSKDDTGHPAELSVVKIMFQSPAGLPVPNELHVSTVYTHEKYRARFLAGALYILLSRYGYSVVSDFTQYNAGKALWKKMAREAEMRKFAIRIWSDETSDWVKNSQGEVLRYDASNLADENIWQDISQHSQPTTLLVLQTK